MRRRVFHQRLLGWAVALVLLGPHALAAEETWKAGSAKVLITPDKPLWMAGYGSRTRPAEGKLSELWAKALLLEDPAGKRALLITLDLVGIDREFATALCERLQNELNVKREQIALCSSHTHSGPVVGRNLGPMHYLVIDEEQKQRIDEYVRRLEDEVVRIALAAQQDLQPCDLRWGSGTATFAVNRRNNPEAQVPKLRAAQQLAGPSDHDVPVLAAYGGDGALRAVVFGYACHATVLSGQEWSADYPGYAQIELERLHPGCTALFWAGCGGDQNPLPRRRVQLAEHYGRHLANAVEAVLLTTEMHPVTGSLQTQYREIELPFDELPGRAQLEEEARSENRFVASRARMLLAQLDRGAPLAATYPYPVQLWQLGPDVQFILLGGEVVVDYALRLKSELRGKNTWVAAYANDVMAYIPSRRVLAEGGYEGGGAMVYYGLPTIWAPQVEPLIVETVHSLVNSKP